MDGEEEFRRLQATVEREAHPPSENADDLDKGREFTADLTVTLLGQVFKLKPTGGLVALFTYCIRGLGPPGDDKRTDYQKQQAAMAAMFDLLQDCVQDWQGFEQRAMSGKASIEDVEVCIRQVIEAYTARPYWPGIRLLAGAASDLAELDGVVLQGTGRSVATFTAREVCNLQLARVLASQRDDDARQVMLEDLYLDYSPEGVALAQVEAMIASRKAREAEEAARATAQGDGDSPVEPAEG